MQGLVMFVKTIGILITQPPITLPSAKYQGKLYVTWRRNPRGSSTVHNASICLGSIGFPGVKDGVADMIDWQRKTPRC